MRASARPKPRSPGIWTMSSWLAGRFTGRARAATSNTCPTCSKAPDNDLEGETTAACSNGFLRERAESAPPLMNNPLAAGRRRARSSDRRRIPMLVGLAILDSPHIEPRCRIGLVGISGIAILAREGDHDEIPFRGNRCHLGLPASPVRDGRGRAAAEELQNRIEARGDVRVVLNVLFRDVLVGELPMIRFQEIANDVG